MITDGLNSSKWSPNVGQGLLKLFWTVCSEGKLVQSCLKLRNFQTLLIMFIRYSMHKKGIKFALAVELTSQS